MDWDKRDLMHSATKADIDAGDDAMGLYLWNQNLSVAERELMRHCMPWHHVQLDVFR